MRLHHHHVNVGVSGDESESLQADVMRFMAILGLCLMVIFALVQSLPSGLPERAPAAVPAATPEPPAVAAVQSETDAARAAVQARAEALRLAEEAAREAQEQQLRQAAVERERRRVQEAREATRRAAAQLAERARERDAQLAHATQAREAVPTPSEKIRDTVETVEPGDTLQARRAAALEVARRMASARQAETSRPTKDRQGFSLRFASDDALRTLVRNGEATVYARVGQQGWQLDRGGVAFSTAPLPPSYHEMNAGTVSRTFKQALQVASGQPDATAWGVTLAVHLQQAIEGRMRGHSGGDLVIDARGAVSLQ